MEAIPGIKYTKSPNGNKQYVRVDLDMHGDNQLLEDFLDGLDIMSRQDDPCEYVPLEDFMKEEYKRRGLKYEAV